MHDLNPIKLCRIKFQEDYEQKMIVNSKILEIFVDYIESDGFRRDFWIGKVRRLGLNQALAEFEECKSLTIKTYQSNYIHASNVENKFEV